MPPIEAVIFDFGGVIVPGSPAGDDPNSPYAVLEREYGLPAGFLWRAVYIENSGWLRLRVGEGDVAEWDSVSHQTIAAASSAATADAVMEALAADRPEQRRMSGTPPVFNAGMIALIKRLRRDLKVGLLSNARPGLEDDLVTHYQVYGLFHDVINSATVHLAKPDPRIYHLAAARIRVPIDRCFFTDDLAHNVAAARDCGMTAYQFDNAENLVNALAEAGVHVPL